MPNRVKEAFAALLRHGSPVDMEALELHDAMKARADELESEIRRVRALWAAEVEVVNRQADYRERALVKALREIANWDYGGQPLRCNEMAQAALDRIGEGR